MGDRFAMLFPAAEARISVEIDFRSPAIGHQQHTVVVDSDEFRSSIAPARTFGFAEEIAALREEGYARGGSLTNAVVIENDRVISAGGCVTKMNSYATRFWKRWAIWPLPAHR